MQNKRPLFGRESSGNIPIRGTPKLSPFGDNRPHPMDAVVAGTPREAYEIKEAYENPIPTLLPRHLYAPEGARTIDARKIISVAAGGVAPVDLFSFTCPPGATVVFYKYDLYLDAPNADGLFTDLTWVPTIDGSRVLEMSGDPSNGFVGMSFPNQIIGANGFSAEPFLCQILMEPGQILDWTVQNGSALNHLMGVRMYGYLDMSQRLTSSKFGD